MAIYRQPCIHCGALIDRDVRFCPKCGSRSPFGCLCPDCLRPVEKGDPACGGCGRPLYVPCPACGKQTFVDDRCSACGAGLMISCRNRRCGEMQFFQNIKCTACGKKLKK